MHALRYAKDPSQVKLVENQPFPHTLPTNGTAYYNDNGNTTGAGYDGPGECLKHVFGLGRRLYATAAKVQQYWMRINVSEFVLEKDRQQAMTNSAWLFVPPRCKTGARACLLCSVSFCSSARQLLELDYRQQSFTVDSISWHTSVSPQARESEG